MIPNVSKMTITRIVLITLIWRLPCLCQPFPSGWEFLKKPLVFGLIFFRMTFVMLFEVSEETKVKAPVHVVGGKPFVFICGSDDFSVQREGARVFKVAADELVDDFSKEVISGFAQNSSDVETIVSRVISGAQTLSLLGGKKVIWVKDLNFIADSVTGRSESTKENLQRLVEFLAKVNPEHVSIIISASPVDRRTKAFKDLQKVSDYTFIDTPNPADAAKLVGKAEARALNLSISEGNMDILSEKINHNSRLMVEELRKLRTFLGNETNVVNEELIHQLVPQFGDSDFFEFTEAFFSLDIQWALDALKRYFFSQNESRPIIAALQNRNRLLMGLRVLLDSNDISVGYNAINNHTLASLGAKFHFPMDAKEKSSYNLFLQNPWYLSKLVPVAKTITLKRLIDFQEAFLKAFENILEFPNDQLSVLEQMTFECLA